MLQNQSQNQNQDQSQRILIVDDDPTICDFLTAALSPRYGVTATQSGAEAIRLIGLESFDLIITDLVLPDVGGIEVLAYAKSRDEFAEVLMITGHASLDSAAEAINHGVGSYMLKPFSVAELRSRVEKMLASRAFHARSLQLMARSDLEGDAVKGHVDDLTSLYHFTRNLMLTLEISEVMRIMLEEVNVKADAAFCTIEVCLPDYREVYSMPKIGEMPRHLIDRAFADHWSSAFVGIDRAHFESGAIPHYLYKGRYGEFRPAAGYKCRNYPLIVTGKTVGSLSVWTDATREADARLERYLHVLTSVVSPVIEHVYADLLSRLQAKTDSLTGIANHRHFYESLEREIARANRKKSAFALILADIDNFKRINDAHGHQVGDAVIIDLTRHLAAKIRSGDVMARYGGEEFGVILPESNLEGALTLANRICESIANTPYKGAKGIEISYTASFGVAVYDGAKPMGRDELILLADKALYRSKDEGKNKVTSA